MGYWHQRADEGMATLPKVTRSYLWSDLEEPQMSLGWASPWNVKFLPSVFWHCWLGDRKGIRPVKKLGVGLLLVVIWLELWAAYSSNCHHCFHHPLLQWTPANPGSPGRWPLKWRERVCVCVCVCVHVYPSVLWRCWLGNRKGIRPVKKLCWFVDGDIFTGAFTSYSSSCYHHLHHS